VLASRFFQEAASVGLYITCERLREVDTTALLEQALQHGEMGMGQRCTAWHGMSVENSQHTSTAQQACWNRRCSTLGLARLSA
jgi:hypothetical protein